MCQFIFNLYAHKKGYDSFAKYRMKSCRKTDFKSLKSACDAVHILTTYRIKTFGVYENLSWCSSSLSFPQVSVSTDTKKLVVATAFGAVSLLFLARRFQRRKGRKKVHPQHWEQAGLEFHPPAAGENGKISSHWFNSFLFNQQLTGLWSPFSVSPVTGVWCNKTDVRGHSCITLNFEKAGSR